MPIPASTSGIGALTGTSRTIRTWAPTIRAIRRRSSSAIRCTAPQLSNDGLLYVCDRSNDRIQVFKPDGTFVKEVFIAKNTLGDGSVWDIAFSKDPQQKYIYLADGANEKIHIIDRPTSLDPDQLRRWRPAARRILRGAQHRHGFERQHLHDRDLSRAARAEVRLQRHGAGDQEGSGRGLAEGEDLARGQSPIACSCRPPRREPAD